jgi:hypothetical protein
MKQREDLDCRTPPVLQLRARCDSWADEVSRRYRAGRAARIARQLVHALAAAQRVGPLRGNLGSWRVADAVWLLDRWLPEHLRVPDDLVFGVPALLVGVFEHLDEHGLLDPDGLGLDELSSLVGDRADLLRRRLRRANSARRVLAPLPGASSPHAPAGTARTGT